jgi:hypothetical protein
VTSSYNPDRGPIPADGLGEPRRLTVGGERKAEARGERPGGERDGADPSALLVDPLAGTDLDIDAALDAVPVHVHVWPEVNLDADDPALVNDTGRRRCIATKSAGGRCSVGAMHSHVLCSLHAGVLDPSAGGRATAQKRREAKITAEERARLARLGGRGAVVEALGRKAHEVGKAVEVLADAAAAGDVQAAKLLVPYLNQAYGMPQERVALEAPSTPEEIRALPTAELLRLVRESA